MGSGKILCTILSLFSQFMAAFSNLQQYENPSMGFHGGEKGTGSSLLSEGVQLHIQKDYVTLCLDSFSPIDSCFRAEVKNNGV